MSVLSLALLLLSLPARGETLRQACVNEIELFCQGKTGRALSTCLSDNFGNSTARCQAHLKAPAPGQEATVWGSEASVGDDAADDESSIPEDVDVSTDLSGFSAFLDESETSYELSGDSIAALTADLNAGSGLYDSIDNGAAAAVTSGGINVTYATAPGPGGCALAGARVGVSVRQTLPRWNAPADAAPPVKDWWGKVSSAIKKHEDGHKERWIAAGNDAAAFLKRLAPMRDCAQVKQAVESELGAANTDGMRRNVAWDQETRHGKAQFDEAFGRVKPGSVAR